MSMDSYLLKDDANESQEPAAKLFNGLFIKKCLFLLIYVSLYYCSLFMH